MKPQNDSNKLVFLAENLSQKDDLLCIFCKKMNWLAENTEYEVYLILTEKNKKPARYALSPKVIMVNLEVNYEQLEGHGFIYRLLPFWYKQCIHKLRLKDALCKIKPFAIVSMMGKELSFLSRIGDGSIKIYEFHSDKMVHMGINNVGISTLVNRIKKCSYLVRMALFITKQDIVVFDTECLYKNLNKMFKNTVVIHNPLKEYPLVLEKNESMKVMAVGDYLSINSFNHLIDVWERISRKYPNWRLHLYGFGNQDYCRNQIVSKHLGKVIQCYDRPNDLSGIYSKYAIFVQAYEFDMFGWHLMEAMSYGLPCVAYDVPYGPQDVINDESNGFLVKPNQLVDFASKVGILIRKDDLREEMGKRAHEDICKYEINSIMKEWIKLYESISVR